MDEQIFIQIEDYYAPWDRWFENRIYPSPEGISIFYTEITEHKKAEEKIVRLNRLYSVLSKVNEAIVRIQESEKLYQEICHIIVQEGLLKMAWIGIVDTKTLMVKPVAIWGHEEGYLKEKRISVDERIPEGRGPTGTAIRKGGYFICNDIERDPIMLPWREEALKRGYRSSATFALKKSGKIIGTVNVYSNEAYFFQEEEEIKLFISLADDISFAIEAAENEWKRRQTEEDIRKLNIELEQRVKERTAKLEDKIAEIERMNKLFVGRELRIIELKEKIKDLESKIQKTEDKKLRN